MQDFVLRQAIKSFTWRRFTNVVKSVAAFAVSVVTRRPVVWGIPPVMTVEPTNYCNLECPLCVTGSGAMQRAGGRMSLDMFKNLIDEIADRIWYVIFYHQGEPYLNNAFLPAVAYAKAKGLYTETSTNAHYLHPENARRTVEAGLDAIIVSVDGTTQASYEKYRVRGELDRVLAGIRNLIAAKQQAGSRTPYVLLQFLVMRHNEHEIPAVQVLARELGVDRLLLKNIQVETYAEALEWMPRTKKFQRYEVGKGEIRVRRGGRTICPRPWLSSLVNWDGRIVPCCFDKNAAHPMGAVPDRKFIEIWNNGDYAAFRKAMLERRQDIEICRNCNQGLYVWI